MWKTWALAVVVLIGVVSWARADPGYDGEIVDVYIGNLRSFLRINDLDIMKLPDFDLSLGKYWSIQGTSGSFGNLSTVQWADGATVIKNGDVINVATSLFIPDPHIRYSITLFQLLGLSMDVKVITNALHLNLDFNTTDCTITFNRIEIYYFENIFPQVLLNLLDNPLVPREYAEYVESGIAMAIKMTNFALNVVIKPILTNQLSQVLTAGSKQFNLCPIFEIS